MGIREDFKDILIVDEDGRIEYFTIYNLDFFGLTPNVMLGTKPYQHYKNLDDETSTLMRAVNHGETTLGSVQELETAKSEIVRQTSDTFCIKRDGEVIGAIEFAYYDDEKDVVRQNLQDSAEKYCGDMSQTIDEIISGSKAMKPLVKKLRKLADWEAPVLITGETGSGKSYIARALHNSGKRQRKKFVYINCSSVPENLFESILFGVKKGAFTDATERDGLFLAADQGSIFLDEIQSTPLSVQKKLLRVLEEKRIRPVGGDEELDIDVRIIASCSKDIDSLLKSGQMRSDLYFRLAVTQLEVPPLRERREDIELLSCKFLEKLNCMDENKKVTGVDSKTLQFFYAHDWPGNVRELKNILESGFYTAKDNIIHFNDIKGRFEKEDGEAGEEQNIWVNMFDESGKDLRTFMNDFQKNIIVQELQRNSHNIPDTAKALGISSRMLKYNIEKYGLK